MSLRIDVVGGPLDGLDVRAGNPFVWLGLRADRGTAFAKAASGRYLYRRARVTRGRKPWPMIEVYLYAGDAYWHCPGCGGFVRKVEGGSESLDCQLCGGSPVLA